MTSIGRRGGPWVVEDGGIASKPIPSYLCSEEAVRADSTTITIVAWDRVFSGPKGEGLKPIGWKEFELKLLVRKSLADEVRAIFKQIHDTPVKERVPIRSDKDKDGVSEGIQGFNFRCKSPCIASYGSGARCLEAVSRPTEKGKVDCRKCLSAHSQAFAFDITPSANPYKTKGGPNPYWDRKAHPRNGLYAIRVTDIIYQAFVTHGWGWGGLWTKSKDYMHFSKNDE